MVGPASDHPSDLGNSTKTDSREATSSRITILRDVKYFAYGYLMLAVASLPKVNKESLHARGKQKSKRVMTFGVVSNGINLAGALFRTLPVKFITCPRFSFLQAALGHERCCSWL